MCRGSSPDLVGRTGQLAALADALTGARQGGHPALLIGGEAGVGKSRLLAEFAATAPDARMLTAGCLQLGGEELPFTPFAAILRGLVRELRACARPAVRRAAAASSARAAVIRWPRRSQPRSPAGAAAPR